MPSKRRILFPLIAILLILSSLTTGCSGSAADKAEHEIKLAPLAAMPAEVQSAPVTVQQAYQFAVANPDVLQRLPCYCGCGAMGHTSNYACYVAGTAADGSTEFDPHALGCSICVDITQDAMRLLKQGQDVTNIKAYVDGAYSRFGPTNMP
ncbi:MAG TPA: PCYCGC motif-containing (lipo)protein [Anaerolineae bacterium]|nr:PCYCGC motif-containing (lipo)protein [Anaerolineae bacterium]